MATTPGSKRRDTRTTTSGELPPDPETLGTMQEPLGSTERPIHRTSDMNDLNISDNGAGRTAGNLGTTGSAERRGVMWRGRHRHVFYQTKQRER